VCLKEEDRRALLRSLNEDEYRDVMVVCSMLPNVEMNICCEGKAPLNLYVILIYEYMFMKAE